MVERAETYAAIRKALASLDDPFTRLLEPARFAALRRGTTGSFSGVGLEVGFDTATPGAENELVVGFHNPTQALALQHAGSSPWGSPMAPTAPARLPAPLSACRWAGAGSTAAALQERQHGLFRARLRRAHLHAAAHALRVRVGGRRADRPALGAPACLTAPLPAWAQAPPSSRMAAAALLGAAARALAACPPERRLGASGRLQSRRTCAALDGCGGV